ncbi:hypothetical protein PIB30_013377 [Stylosanthes scabra]|uniref:Uncharacterized protein n=1 Tax=Stylosanthes scabra TaxID=79078 RepID=A0ABU6V9N8_9FABA|nr:hypothetical protein [Stylosanthes scabra]
MAMKSFSVIIVGVVICFVIAESHEIVPNNNNRESYWTPSNYYIANNHEKNISSDSKQLLRELTEYCMEKYWHLRNFMNAPEMMKCIKEGFDNFQGIDHADILRMRVCVENCVEKFWLPPETLSEKPLPPHRRHRGPQSIYPPRLMKQCVRDCFN